MITAAPRSDFSLSALPAPVGEARDRLAGAARQFEAIFIRQMLGAARKGGFGDDLLGGQAVATFRTMQDEKFADLAASQDAFGLAKIIAAQLSGQDGAAAKAAGR